MFRRVFRRWDGRLVGPLFLAAVITTASCSYSSIEPLPLQITITANKLTAAPGDSIAFEIRAQGGRLLGIIVDWGDDTSYLAETFGARTAEASIRHAYTQSGVYGISASVDDQDAGRKTASLSVTIQ